MTFPLEKLFDITKPISTEDAMLMEAEIAQYELNINLSLENKKKAIREAIVKHNKKFNKSYLDFLL